jgi:hypothetical protein
MSWRLFRNRNPRPRPTPIDCVKGYVIDPVRDVAQFMRALPGLLPPDAALVLEGGHHPEVVALLSTHALTDHPTMRKGTLFPRSSQLYLSVAAAPLIGELLARNPDRHLCYHFHAVTKDRVLVEWWDAFSDPVALSEVFPQERVEALCRDVGAEICIVLGYP